MRYAVLVLGLIAAVAAQTPAKPAAPPDAGLQLFRQAAAGLEVLPEMDRPMVLEAILAMELPLYKQQALDGYHHLFQMALALPGGANQFSSYTKGEAELGSIVGLSENGDLDAALELARTADVPRAKMYDFILARAAGHWSAQRGLELVRECVQADGTFPYSGAIRLAKAAQDDAITQRQLIRSVYAAADSQTDMIAFGLNGGFEALTQGHEMAPDLDGELETSLISIITRTGKDPQHINAVLVSRLLSLLQQIAPDRAAELKVTYPELVAVPPRPHRYYSMDANGKEQGGFTEPADMQVEDMVEKDPAGAYKLAASQQDAAMHFRALATVALALAVSKPDLARQA
ncbi:MAG TPA: hypothetical protein VFP94_10500, partial [Terriglobales bacterium]|nr:hypothetical protein [Terriglobales bacterium]